nr:immunoglobulin heavy chain junction region [Mus musculus]
CAREWIYYGSSYFDFW